MKTLIILVMVVCIATITSCKKSTEETEEKRELTIYANEVDCKQCYVGYDDFAIRNDRDPTDNQWLVSRNCQQKRSRIDVYMDSINGYNMRIYGYDTIILHKQECTKYKISMDPKGKGKEKIFIGRFWMLRNSIVDLGYNRLY